MPTVRNMIMASHYVRSPISWQAVRCRSSCVFQLKNNSVRNERQKYTKQKRNLFVRETRGKQRRSVRMADGNNELYFVQKKLLHI